MEFFVFYRTKETFRDAMFVIPDNIDRSHYEQVAHVEAADLEDLPAVTGWYDMCY